MGYLIHIVLALAALAAAEEGVGLPTRAPLAVLALLPLPHALALVDRKLVLAGRFGLAAALYRLIGWAPVALYAISVLLFGWSASVAGWTGAPLDLLGWPGPRTLLALAPFAAFMVASIDARARLGDPRRDELARQRRFQLRMFLASLAPFVLMITASSLVGASELVRVNVEYVGIWGGAFAALLLLVTMVSLPTLLRHAWQTSALPPGRTRALLDGFAARIGFRCRELVQWHTGFQVSNAAVVGLGGGRIVLFSDLLLASLNERELLAVFAHEIAHVRRHHVIVFVAWSLALFLGAQLAITGLDLGDDWAGFGLLGAALAAWYFAFGWFSRRIELEADWEACETTGDVEAMASALERVGGPHGRGKDTWRHFGTERRVEFLARAAADPALARGLQRRLARIGRLGLLLGALALAAQGWLLAASYPEDRVTAALALGRYGEAVELARELESIEPDLAAFVARAESFGETAPPAEWLVQIGRDARERGQRVAALEVLVLARLRGVRGLDTEIAALADDLRTGSR